MLKVILPVKRPIPPFNEPARDLRIQNRPLWLLQTEVLAPYVTRTMELAPNRPLPSLKEPMIVHRDNLFFDEPYIEEFIRLAKKKNRPVRAAFSSEDAAFREHAFPLSVSYTPAGSLYLADLWYYPNGPVADVEPLVIDLKPSEVGYYNVPSYMAGERRNLTFQVPLRALMAIDCWAHVFIADVVFGLFKRGNRFEERLKEDVVYTLQVFARAIYEAHQVLECSELVKIGKNCTIDPRAVIHGPTTIGDNVTIGAGAVIENCIIGNGVNIAQGCQLMLSVVGDGTFLPFRAALFMTTIMENSMVAQNTCLQMCVVGRNTFLGAGSTFTDYNLIPSPIRALDGNDQIKPSNRPVLGGCVGHNCRIGAGMIVFPARTIESDVVLAASKDRRIIDKNITFADSDHHKLKNASQHKVMYQKQQEVESW